MFSPFKLIIMSTEKKTQIIDFLSAFLMLMALLTSSYFFLVQLKLSVGEWLAFNACSMAIITYLLCFVLFQITKHDFLLAIPLLPLYYYGTMGLFIMPWNEANVFPQLTHIIITLTVLWVLYKLLKAKRLESLGKGLLTGLLVFVPVIACIQSYTQVHMQEFLQVLQRM